MSANMNTTTNGTSPWNCLNHTAVIIGLTIAYCLIFVVSLVGNSLVGIIVYKTRTMRKPINFLMVNMAMSDLLFSIFLVPERLTEIHAGSWLISGPLGQALCKLVNLLRDASTAVSVQSLVLIAVDRFGAVAFPHRSPLVSSKLCPFLILATWIVAMALWYPYLIANKLVEHPGRLACEGVWTGFFQVSSKCRLKLHFSNFHCRHLYPFSGGSHLLYYHLYKGQITDDSRRAISQRETATRKKGANCAEGGHCYCVRLSSMLAAQQYRDHSDSACIGHMVLWLPILRDCCLVYVFCILCYKPLYPLSFQ